MSGAADWTAAVAAFVAAGLAYVGARAGSRPEARAVDESRRDEWGRRFSTAIDLMTRPSPRERAMGRGLLDALFTSDLATADDRRMAEGLLAAFVLADVPAAPHISRAPATAPLDEVRFVEDDGMSEAGEGR